MVPIRNENLLAVACGGLPQTKTEQKKIRKQLSRLYGSSLDAIEDILKSQNSKPADRLSAAKLCFEVIKSATPAQVGPPEMHVFLESDAKQFAE